MGEGVLEISPHPALRRLRTRLGLFLIFFVVFGELWLAGTHQAKMLPRAIFGSGHLLKVVGVFYTVKKICPHPALRRFGTRLI